MWRDVIGYEGLYQVSDGGEVRSLDRTVDHGRGFTRWLTGKTFKPRPDGEGYPRVCLSKAGKEATRRTHQLVLEAFVGPKPEGYVTRHLNGIPSDNRVENLCWGTQMQNQADRKLHGTSNEGERGGGSKLTETQVLEIRALYSTGRYTQQVLGDLYGAAQTNISLIVRRKNWKHI